jgi:hypothetical protein
MKAKDPPIQSCITPAMCLATGPPPFPDRSTEVNPKVNLSNEKGEER